MHLNPGILPDIMHLSHLAIIPDICLSLLCDITDGPHRDDKLDDLFENYRSFCESQGNRDPITVRWFGFLLDIQELQLANYGHYRSTLFN